MLNPNIIARDLGLADKQDVTTNGESLNKGRTLDDFYAQSNVPVKP